MKTNTMPSVREEWKDALSQKCSCGGVLEIVQQSLCFEESNEFGKGAYDIFTCECVDCKRKYEFKYNIDSFFWKPDPEIVGIFKNIADKYIKEEKGIRNDRHKYR